MQLSLYVGGGVPIDGCFYSGSGPPPIVANDFMLAVEGESRRHCDEVFAALSDGGTVITPLEEMFWGAYYGMWTDRFEINWLINYTLP